MEIYFRTENKIIKMKDIIEVDRNYLVVSSLDGSQKCVLAKYSSEKVAKNILDNIDSVITAAIMNDKRDYFIEIPREETKNG